MNHTYKHIWSKVLGRLIVVPECCKGGQGKKGGRRRLGAFALATASLLAGPAFAQSVLPTGGTVVSGAAAIATSGTAMTITQSSDKLITNWSSFSIGSGNSVTFNQPGASSVALNRVTGQDASQILGSLTANGQVFLINPNGIAIGKTGSVQTGAFVASTLDISNDNFLAGNYRFTGTSGTITNEGTITGNTVALISPVVSNSGTITGNTALAAGTDVQLDFNGDGLLSVEVKASTMATLVENKGLIKADGGVAILTAKGASAAMKGVVNNTGTVEANSIGTKNGRILLLGDMQYGEVKAAGTLKAKSVETSAAKVTIDKDLKVDTQGGNWLIDPTDITVDSSNVAAYVSALATGNVTIQTPSTGSDAGNITINAAMSWNALTTLSLAAAADISINAAITAANGGLIVSAGSTNNISATAAVNVGAFVLASGNWVQNAATLPDFSALDFRIADGASFLRVLGGDGVGSAFLLADVYGLQGVGSSASYLAASWKLANDIDASGTATWNSGAGFKPLASGSSFSGTLDGNSYNISGLSILSPSGNTGLFDTIGIGGSVLNLGIINAIITSGDYYTGILAGVSFGTVSNVHVSGSVTSAGTTDDCWCATYFGIGGLVGWNGGTISNASSASTVSTTGFYQEVGGLVGVNDSTGSISNAYSTGAVTTTSWLDAGGLVGRSRGTISNVYATGDVSAGQQGSKGGLVGYNETGLIINAYATGNVSADAGITLGGLVGWNSGTIKYAYATGAVSASFFSYVGGLVGYNGYDGASISNAYATGAVSAGNDSYAGGLVGFAWASSIDHAYATGSVSGGDYSYVAGLVGAIGKAGFPGSGGAISNAYATGAVSGGYSAIVGGLVGRIYSSSVSDSFWDTETTGQSSGVGLVDSGSFSAAGLTTAQARTAAAYTGWDFSTVWYQVGDMRPILRSEAATADSNGVITISNLHQLALIGANLSGSYVLGADIDASASVGSAAGIWSTNGWVPIASSTATFTGSLDGAGHTITGLTISRSGTDSVGLFSYVGPSGTITDLSLVNASVTGSTTVGALVGLNAGTISQSSVSGSVSGTVNVGGLVGFNTGTITQSYASGSVSGTDVVGGLVGYSAGTITQTYASGSVTASVMVGGLAGENDGTITASFFNTTTTGQSSGVGTGTTTGVTGLTTAQMADPFTFIDAGWDFASTWATLQTGGAPVLRNQTTDPIYNYYVRLSGDSSMSYGDTFNGAGITLSGVGTGNVSINGNSTLQTTNVGTYAYDSSILSLAYAAGTAADYYVDYGSGTLTINKRVINLSGSRSYDGSTDVAASILTLGNLVNGETLTLTGIGQLASRNAGTGLSFSLGTLALGDGSGLASNYTLAGGTYSIDMAKAVITSIAGITALSKNYDGTTSATLVTSDAVFNGILAGDLLSIATGTGNFASASAGDGKTVYITGLSLGGRDAGNYTLALTTAMATAAIKASANAIDTSVAPLPPPSTIDTGISAVNSIGSNIRQSFVVTTNDAFTRPPLIDVVLPRSAPTGNESPSQSQGEREGAGSSNSSDADQQDQEKNR